MKPTDGNKNSPFAFLIIFIMILSFGICFYTMRKVITKDNVEEETLNEIDPFDYLNIKYSGSNGEGIIDVEIKPNDKDIILQDFYIDISEKRGLSNDDKVKVNVSSSKYILKNREKTFTVKGLDDYLTDAGVLSEDDIKIIKSAAKDNLAKATKNVKDTTKMTDRNFAKIYLLSDGAKKNILYYVEKIDYKTKNNVDFSCYLVVYFKNAIIYHGDQPRLDYYSTSHTGGVLAIDDNRGGYVNGYNSLEEVKQSLYKGQPENMTLTEK